MTFYERLERVMEAQQISWYKLAKEIGIDQSNFTRWSKGEYAPKTSTLKKISDYLGVSINYLVYGNEQEEKETSISNKIPVLGVVPCGIPIEAVENVIEYVDVLPNMSKNHFGLLAKGDSMLPFIQKSDILIVKQTPVIKSGKIGIVKINGNEATCKKVLISDSGITLVSLNTKYDPQFFSKDEVISLPITIIGEVVEIRRRL